MHKVRESMKSSGNYPMDGEVHMDEFVVGGKELERPDRSYGGKKKKMVCAIQLTKEGKVKRFYVLQIKDFSVKSLRYIFDRHIGNDANVTTDEWKRYRPIMKNFKISPKSLGI